MARAHGARSQMAMAFETIGGVPPTSGYTRMPFASSTLSSEQALLTSELVGYGRDPMPPILDDITVDGAVTVPIDAEAFGFWLKGAFGDPITSGSAAPYTHEFRTGGWTLPTMAIEVGIPETPRYAMYSGSLVNNLSWTMQRSGLLTANVELVGYNETLNTTTQVGTPAPLGDLRRFAHFHGKIRRNGFDLCDVVSAEITYSNNLELSDTIRGDCAIAGAEPGLATLTGAMDVRFSNNALFEQAIAGDPCELEFEHLLPSGERLLVTIHAVYLPRPRVEIQGPQGIQATFNWQAARDATVGRMATITLVNDIEEY